LWVARHHERLGRIDRLYRPQIVAEPADIGGEVLALAEQAGIDFAMRNGESASSQVGYQVMAEVLAEHQARAISG
jgi:hypothetical protein